MLDPSSGFYFSQGLRLHYVDWGNPGAPPAVLVHGGRDHCRNWDWVANELRRDFHVVAPDLRGHGDSDWAKGGGYTFPGYVYDLAQFIDQLDLAPVTLIGHSRGGQITIRFTAVFPEKVSRLVAIEGLGRARRATPADPPESASARFRTWVETSHALSTRPYARYKTLEEACARMKAGNPRLSDERAMHLTIHGMNRQEDGSYTWKFDNLARLNTPFEQSQSDIESMWGAISCPTLLVGGHETHFHGDPVADGRIGHFRKAKAAMIPDAGHWVHHDQYEAFMSALRDFLQETKG